jgi:S-adenosylmethionine hydrolase
MKRVEKNPLPPAGIITMTTDFGVADGYQGVLEGVIYSINPTARIVTISHLVEPGNIAGGWYLLKTHTRFFPPGTIHLAVVDPGVGTRRKIVAVRTRSHFFVGPDNGLFSFLPEREIVSIHSVTNRKYALPDISPVFHGRDIMAPAAAHLSLGLSPGKLGRKVTALAKARIPRPTIRRNEISGTVLHIDRFGNLISNIESRLIGRNDVVFIGGTSIGPVQKAFSDVGSGKPVAYIGSGGHLEIAVRDGSAKSIFGIQAPGEANILVARRGRGA